LPKRFDLVVKLKGLGAKAVTLTPEDVDLI
jgi:hypothetical protein